MELCQLTAYQLHEMLLRKEVTSREITESVLKRIAKVEDRIHAFITFDPGLGLAASGPGRCPHPKRRSHPSYGNSLSHQRSDLHSGGAHDLWVAYFRKFYLRPTMPRSLKS